LFLIVCEGQFNVIDFLNVQPQKIFYS
jgi:hypothetical protein